MLDQQDSFYKQLPFTLSAEQAKPNFVIFGTGLQQCLIAAHYSKIKMKPGLIIDMERTYGSCLKTVTIKQLYCLSIGKVKVNLYQFLKLQQFKQMNQKFYQDIVQNKKHRGYNIDLEPNFFFGSSISCQMLKDAEMDKYMDFRLVYNMLHFDSKGFKNVPLSKGKIFQSKDLGLLQKKLLLNTFHSLSQIYNKFMNVEQDQNSTKQFDKQFGQVDQKLYTQFLSQKTQSFIKFIQKMTKNNQKIMNYIIYILCNYQYNYKNQKQIPEHARNDYTLEEFIRRFGKFAKSCGVYGQCPYLYVDNGIGDVPQAYSRIASIYLSTYILHPKIQITKIQLPQLQQKSSQNQTTLAPSQPLQQPIKIFTNLYPQGSIETTQIFYGPTCYNLKYTTQQDYNREYTLRVIFISKKLGQQQQCPAIVYLLDLKQNQNPVYLFMLDHVSHSCPEQLILYQFQTVVNDKSQQACLRKVNVYLEVLEKTRGQQYKNSLLYTTAYIRQKRYPKQPQQTPNKEEDPLQTTSLPKQTILRDHSGIDLDSHFINFKQIVGEHKHYFKKDKELHEQNQEQYGYGENQTVGLIERLHAIDIYGNHHDGQLLQVKDNKQEYEQTQKQQIKENQQPSNPQCNPNQNPTNPSTPTIQTQQNQPNSNSNPINQHQLNKTNEHEQVQQQPKSQIQNINTDIQKQNQGNTEGKLQGGQSV